MGLILTVEAKSKICESSNTDKTRSPNHDNIYVERIRQGEKNLSWF